MEIMVGIAVLVNCALIGLSGTVHRMFPEATPIQTILVIVALEVIHQVFHMHTLFIYICFISVFCSMLC